METKTITIKIEKSIIIIFTVMVVLLISIAILVQIFFFTQVKIPYGIWQSNNPDITININPYDEYYCEYSGEYIKEGETIPITVIFIREGSKFDELRIYDVSSVDGNMISGSAYFAGTWKYKKTDKKLHFKLYSKFQELTGYETIVFEKIHSYD